MRIPTVMGTMVALLLPASVALATHAEPAKASKASFTLVNGFRECTSPNTAMQSNGMDACAPVSPNGLCAFGPGGSGKLSFAKTGNVAQGTQDLKILAVATGLNVSCEGLPLDVRLSYRLTSDDCLEGSCTAVDTNPLFATLLGAECVVTNGKCKIKTTLNTAAPGRIPNGKNAGIEILGCGLKGPLFPIEDEELRCGVLLK